MPAPNCLLTAARKRCIKSSSPCNIPRNIFLSSLELEFFKNRISMSAANSSKEAGPKVKLVFLPNTYSASGSNF